MKAVTIIEELKKNPSTSTLRELIHSILSSKTKSSGLIHKAEEIFAYKDVLFFTWKFLVKILSIKNDHNDTLLLNVLQLLEKISMDAVEKSDENELLGLKEGTKDFVFDISIVKRFMRKCWQFLTNIEMTPIVHKKLLLVLIESYLSKLDNPIYLTDFLMASMNIKGVIRILALQGIATLVQKHNIEYPNIFGKLYQMFEPSIFHAKYKSRLFYLANIFLSSTHLPEAMVASFAKRASRLSLKCGAPDVLIIIRFVQNLLIRHVGLKRMIHHTTILEVSEDPFLMEEEDPMKTHASESSLWELSLLSNHCQPRVSSAAKFIYSNLPVMEFDLSEVLSSSYQDMFESECKKKKQKPSLTFVRPQQTLAKLKDDRLFKLWNLTK